MTQYCHFILHLQLTFNIQKTHNILILSELYFMARLLILDE